jgi:tRNA pseudouridine13 synthase
LIVKRTQLLLRLMVARGSPSSGQDVVEAGEGGVEAEVVYLSQIVHFQLFTHHVPGTGGGDRAPRGTYPPYIHFTLQKTNRDTQDALAHLSRLLHVNIRDLSVAGTKDKRGVTVQRVALRRHNKTVEDVWKLANGQVGRKSRDEVSTRRGERGIRIADLNYRKSFLDLGMLKGNAFVITLRCVFGNTLSVYLCNLSTVRC